MLQGLAAEPADVGIIVYNTSWTSLGVSMDRRTVGQHIRAELHIWASVIKVYLCNDWPEWGRTYTRYCNPGDISTHNENFLDRCAVLFALARDGEVHEQGRLPRQDLNEFRRDRFQVLPIAHQ